jgi:multidrug efflux system outer membrane protein
MSKTMKVCPPYAARRLAAVTLLGLLAGCTVGPRFSPSTANLPATWSTPMSARPGQPSTVATAPTDDAWWTHFGDPELDSLIERASRANLDARQAVLRVEEARAQRRLAAAGALPQLDAGGSYETTRISEKTATTSLLSALGGHSAGAAPGGVAASIPGLQNPFSTYQYGLNASWELDLFGRVRRTIEAADADTLAAEEDARAVRVVVLAEVAAAYVDLRGVQAQRALSAEALKTAQDQLRLAADSRRQGLGNDVDLHSATAAAASLEATLPILDQQASVDRNQLALLLAAAPGSLDGELQSAAPTPPAPLVVPIGLPSDLARRRPDIREAEAALHAAVARQGVAVASLYPSVSLNAGFGFEASRPAALTDWAARYLTAGPSIDVPVFDAGQRLATIRIEDARAKSAAVSYAQTVLEALDQAEDAVSAYGQQQARRASLQVSANESQAAFDLAQRSYRAGSSSYRAVLEAQAKLQQAQLALAAGAALTDEDLVGLYRALGGGWQMAEQDPKR